MCSCGITLMWVTTACLYVDLRILMEDPALPQCDLSSEETASLSVSLLTPLIILRAVQIL